MVMDWVTKELYTVKFHSFFLVVFESVSVSDGCGSIAFCLRWVGAHCSIGASVPTCVGGCFGDCISIRPGPVAQCC